LSHPALDKLLRIGQLKVEPCNPLEAQRLMAMASTRLADARLVATQLLSSGPHW
jgi:hypothetical protein